MKGIWALVLAASCGGGDDGAPVAPMTAQCGAGTHDESGVCVADARFELRGGSAIRADGYTPYEIRAFGIDATGASIHDRVVVTVDRADAGTVVSPAFSLGDLGGSTTFVPCNGSTPSCVGAARFDLALVK